MDMATAAPVRQARASTPAKPGDRVVVLEGGIGVVVDMSLIISISLMVIFGDSVGSGVTVTVTVT
jgi:hypothetical protein